MNLKEMVEKEDFSMKGKSLPEGDVYLNVNTCKSEKIEREYNGEKKTRYQLKDNGVDFEVGKMVMNGLEKAIKDGFVFVRITRQGTTKEDTTYTVKGLNRDDLPASVLTKLEGASAPSSSEKPVIEKNVV